MFTKEQYAAHEQAVIDAKQIALEHVQASGLPDKVIIDESSLSGIGRRAEKIAISILHQLKADCVDSLPEVVALAARMSLYTMAEGAAYMALGQAAGFLGKNDYVDRMCVPEGYGENEGVAWTLYNGLHEMAPMPDMAKLREIAEFDLGIIRIVVLEAAALYWFSKAATAFKSGDFDAGLEFQAEAFDALALAGFDRGWDAALENKAEESPVTSFARLGADGRHRENRAMREQVFSWLDANMARLPSMEAAASAIA